MQRRRVSRKMVVLRILVVVVHLVRKGRGLPVKVVHLDRRLLGYRHLFDIGWRTSGKGRWLPLLRLVHRLIVLW